MVLEITEAILDEDYR